MDFTNHCGLCLCRTEGSNVKVYTLHPGEPALNILLYQCGLDSSCSYIFKESSILFSALESKNECLGCPPRLIGGICSLTNVGLLTGVINTPLGRHVYGESYLGSAVKLAVGILAWPWFKSPAQGAATSITAAVSPDLEAHSGELLKLDGLSMTAFSLDAIGVLTLVHVWLYEEFVHVHA